MDRVERVGQGRIPAGKQHEGGPVAASLSASGHKSQAQGLTVVWRRWRAPDAVRSLCESLAAREACECRWEVGDGNLQAGMAVDTVVFFLLVVVVKYSTAAIY